METLFVESNFCFMLKERKKKKNVSETVVYVCLTDIDNRSTCTQKVDNTP